MSSPLIESGHQIMPQQRRTHVGCLSTALSPCSIKESVNTVRRPALAAVNVPCVPPMLASSVSHISRARLPASVKVRGKGMMRDNIKGSRLSLAVYYSNAPSIWRALPVCHLRIV